MEGNDLYGREWIVCHTHAKQTVLRRQHHISSIKYFKRGRLNILNQLKRINTEMNSWHILLFQAVIFCITITPIEWLLKENRA